MHAYKPLCSLPHTAEAFPTLKLPICVDICKTKRYENFLVKLMPPFSVWTRHLWVFLIEKRLSQSMHMCACAHMVLGGLHLPAPPSSFPSLFWQRQKKRQWCGSHITEAFSNLQHLQPFHKGLKSQAHNLNRSEAGSMVICIVILQFCEKHIICLETSESL